jgi:hypothetical protein
MDDRNLWGGGSNITSEYYEVLQRSLKLRCLYWIYKAKGKILNLKLYLKLQAMMALRISGLVNNKFIENQKLYGGSKRLSAIETTRNNN